MIYLYYENIIRNPNQMVKSLAILGGKYIVVIGVKLTTIKNIYYNKYVPK